MKNLLLLILLLTVPTFTQARETTDKERCTYHCIDKQVEWSTMCREKYKDFWDVMSCGQKFKPVFDQCIRDCGSDPDRVGFGDICK